MSKQGGAEFGLEDLGYFPSGKAESTPHVEPAINPRVSRVSMCLGNSVSINTALKIILPTSRD